MLHKKGVPQMVNVHGGQNQALEEHAKETIMTTFKNKRRYWGVIGPVMPANMLAQVAKQQEDMGLEGTLAVQMYGPPWISLAAAATATSRLQLASSIALAFTRSPFETAMAAMDLDRISEGRFILGLGPSTRSICQGFYGMSYGKPLEHLRETIDVIRLIIAKSHTGELKSFKGKYYEMDFSEFQPVAQPIRANLPIWIAALRGRSIELGAEIADGIISHAIWPIQWATTVMPKHLKAGLARAGRQRSDVHVCCEFFVTPNKDVKQSIEDARGNAAFYGGVEQYEEYFAALGFRAEAKKLQEGVKRGGYRSVINLVPDEMASTLAVTGTPDEVAKKIEPIWEFADSVCLCPPVFTLELEKSFEYLATIAQTFYT